MALLDGKVGGRFVMMAMNFQLFYSLRFEEGYTAREYALAGGGDLFYGHLVLGIMMTGRALRLIHQADLNSSFWNEITILPREERCNNTILD